MHEWAIQMSKDMHSVSDAVNESVTRLDAELGFLKSEMDYGFRHRKAVHAISVG